MVLAMGRELAAGKRIAKPGKEKQPTAIVGQTACKTATRQITPAKLERGK